MPGGGCGQGLARRSALCRGLTCLINLPGNLLHRLYTTFQLTFEDSFFARLAFSLGESTAIAQSWAIMLLWVIPFSYWNNAYSLIAFAALLVWFHAGAMHRRDYRLDLAGIGFYPLVLFGAVFLGVLLSYAPSLSFRFLFYHISAALCVLVTVSAVRTLPDLKRLARRRCGLCGGLRGLWYHSAHPGRGSQLLHCGLEGQRRNAWTGGVHLR